MAAEPYGIPTHAMPITLVSLQRWTENILKFEEDVEEYPEAGCNNKVRFNMAMFPRPIY